MKRGNSDMKKVISFFSTKGGVGKTTSCTFMAHELASQGFKVLVLDLCQNGNISKNFGYDPYHFAGRTFYEWFIGERSIEEVAVEKDNIVFIPADEKVEKIESWVFENHRIGQDKVLKKKIEPFREIFDYILIDTHPTSESWLNTMGLVASDFVVIPTSADGNDFLGAKRAAEIVNELKEEGVNIDYSIIHTRIKLNNFGVTERLLEENQRYLKENKIDKFAETYISQTDKMAEFTSNKLTYDKFKKHKNSGKIVTQYKKLIEELSIV
ncbi:Sporulation initiation inhibitor protein soj [Bacillus cereus AH1272]|nr:Sporulation initiation inhibitor protein soj [Bacillus cereus AH1272]EEL90512.1 Sporulation initiation inhibitor protein soj [Bacillus cereus AH1273]